MTSAKDDYASDGRMTIIDKDASGSVIRVDDAYPTPHTINKTTVFGKSDQLTTTGKNLVNHTAPLNQSGNRSFIGDKLDNGFILDSLTDTYGTKRIATMRVHGGIKAGDTIIVSCNYKRLSGDIEMPSIYLSDEPQEYGLVINKPYIAKNNHSLVGIYLDEATNSKMEITDVQLIKGSTPIAYEPYTGGKPSPSPDYPQEITNLNKAELVITGRNICPDAELLGKVEYNLGIPTNRWGIQANFPYVQSTETNGIGAVLNTIKGVTYSIAYLGKANTAAVGIAEYKSIDDVGDIGKVVSYVRVGSSKKTSLTASIDGVMVFILASQWTNGTTNLNTFAKEDMIISIGEPQDSYEPNESKSALINLQGNELCSLPNGVKDEVVIDADGNVSLIKRVASALVTSDIIRSAGEHANGQKYVIVVLNNCVRDEKPNVMCSTYMSNTWTDSDKQIYIPSSTGAVITDSRFADKETAANILTAMNLTIFYQLAEPQTIPLGKVEAPVINNTVSTIYTNTNIPTTMNINYKSYL